MKIIFEGVDGSGKTEAAKALEKTCSMNYLHFGPEANTFLFLNRQLMDFKDHNFIFDRFHLSAVIYGEVLRNEDKNRLELHIIEQELKREGCIVVICMPRWETVLNNHDGKEGYKEAELEQLYYRYTDHKLTTLPTLYFDYEAEAYDDLFERIATLIIEIATGITYKEGYPHGC